MAHLSQGLEGSGGGRFLQSAGTFTDKCGSQFFSMRLSCQSVWHIPSTTLLKWSSDHALSLDQACRLVPEEQRLSMGLTTRQDTTEWWL